MKKIKHSKFKNTGILFELLTRQITVEILDGDKTNIARKLVSEFFGKSKELNKELRLYELLTKERYNTEPRAEKFVDTVAEAYARLDRKKLEREKYNLVKSIKESFDLDKFFSSPISNYKLLASVYKVFESKITDNYDIKDAFNAKITIIENIIQKPVDENKKSKKDDLLEYYRNQEKDLRLLTYKILVETFNKKYTTLDERQKRLLKEYINNATNTSSFSDYLKKEIPTLVNEMKTLRNNIKDKVTEIKLTETISILERINVDKKVKDSQVSAMMIAYELVKELKDKVSEDC